MYKVIIESSPDYLKLNMVCEFTRNKKCWLAITVPTTSFYEDIVASYLIELTGTGVEFSERGVTAYLPLDSELSSRLSELNKFLSRIMGDNLGEQNLWRYSKVVYEEDWCETWKEYFKPTKIGKKIIVAPSWEKYQPRESELVINIDPGRAFGVGTHPTTRMCLTSIERFAEKRAKITGGQWTLCDVGCGTGILAIAAAKLGAKHVIALDVDPVAIQTTISNCAQNKVKEKIKVILGSIEKVTTKFQIVVANLTRKPILELAPCVKNILEPGGTLILSGLLEVEMEEVDQLYRGLGFRLMEKCEESEWGLLWYSTSNSENT